MISTKQGKLPAATEQTEEGVQTDLVCETVLKIGLFYVDGLTDLMSDNWNADNYEYICID